MTSHEEGLDPGSRRRRRSARRLACVLGSVALVLAVLPRAALALEPTVALLDVEAEAILEEAILDAPDLIGDAPQSELEIQMGRLIAQPPILEERSEGAAPAEGSESADPPRPRTPKIWVSLGDVITDAASFRSIGRHPARPQPPSRPQSYALPVDRTFLTRENVQSLHHDYPAWDLAVPVGTELYSVVAGRVSDVLSGGRCGNGVIVRGLDGYSYLYCHGSEVTARRGQKVEAGDLVMLSGNTGRSTGPHLHLQVRGASGSLICPQGALLAWFDGEHLSPGAADQGNCWYATPEGEEEIDEDKKKKRKKGKGRGSGGGGDSRDKGKAEKGSDSSPKSPSPPRVPPGPKTPSFPPPSGPKPKQPKPSPVPSPSPQPTPTQSQDAVDPEASEGSASQGSEA